jgi:hypothetical protein
MWLQIAFQGDQIKKIAQRPSKLAENVAQPILVKLYFTSFSVKNAARAVLKSPKWRKFAQSGHSVGFLVFRSSNSEPIYFTFNNLEVSVESFTLSAAETSSSSSTESLSDVSSVGNEQKALDFKLIVDDVKSGQQVSILRISSGRT